MRIVLIIGLALGLLTAGRASAAEAVLRLSHPMPPSHHIAKLIDGWAADIQSASGGRIEVQIFGAEQAFKAPQNIVAVARGQIEAAASVNFQWGETVPEMNVTILPFLLTDLERIRRFPGSPAAAFLEEKLAQKGVVNLAWLYTSRLSVFTSQRRPLIQSEDFRGVKIRGLNRLVDNALVAVGAAPSAMPAPEVYQALQSGVLDAGMTDLSAAYSRKFFEVQKYGTVTPISAVYYHIYVNPDWYRKLAPDLRDVLSAASRKITIDAIPATEAAAEEAMLQLSAKGMVLHTQTAEEVAAFTRIMQPPVLKAFLEASPDGQKILDLLNGL
ncbi:TRAP transporter substrate-binding protein DctP [Lacibacterium aquatile]|uniref:TRAP transporter substrate-binding protein DctP n=1 Tax=Lacibacterium aquatile TaxID=1168082 RepID=A0ABW5DPT0_9PROT